MGNRDGVRIITVDNPGWSIKINLDETDLEYKDFNKIIVDNGENDWYHCEVKDKYFHGVGDISKLNVILRKFIEWVENN